MDDSDAFSSVVTKAQQLVSERFHCTARFADAFLRSCSVIHRVAVVDVARDVVDHGAYVGGPGRRQSA